MIPITLLERVKFLLKIADDKKDKEIEYYLEEITTAALSYCNLTELTEKEIESLVVNKVATIVGSNASFTESSNREVASISRGGMSISYGNTTEGGNVGYSKSILLSEAEKKILRKYRKLRYK